VSPDSNAAPETVVQRQTDAYNDGDIEAFTACYADDARIERLGEETPVAEGHAEIHDEYSQLFNAVPDLTCEVTDEFVVGEYVACKERVTGMDEPMDAFALYLVQSGVIRRLWLAGE
jgi:hypothetical protein